jgi:GNAT superfamily N-acetyltransferase
MDVTYQLEPDLLPAEFIDVLVRSTLAERRPVHDAETIRVMLANADVIVTARVAGRLVGVARSLSDFAFCTYLSDLAVDEAYQRRGLGKELVRRTHEAAGLHTTLLLLAAPKAQGYYPHIGLTRHDSCWMIPRRGSEKEQ